MALNSNFVINRVGLTPSVQGGDDAVETPGDLEASYTASRLGLALSGQDQPLVIAPEETPESVSDALDGEGSLDSRLGISSESQTSQDTVAVCKPFWPKFRDAAAVLAGAVKEGILGKLEPPRKVDAPTETSQTFVYPVAPPISKEAANKSNAAYRRGTYKMPTELIARLRTCAKANHKYQYKLVTESLDEFLTSKGFAKAPEIEDNDDREVEVKSEVDESAIE
jgi:hypothetical protein